jgi:hypothetical protein
MEQLKRNSIGRMVGDFDGDFEKHSFGPTDHGYFSYDDSGDEAGYDGYHEEADNNDFEVNEEEFRRYQDDFRSSRNN